MEVSLTTVGGGLNTGDAWPDGIFTRYGERRHIGPAGMPRGMTQIVAPASDVIYGGDGSQIPEPDLGGGTFKRTKITPALVATNAVLDPWKDLRSDEPPLTPNQRVYGRRAFGKSPQYTIPRESADFVFTGGDKEQDILVKPTTPPEGNMQHGNDIAHTPEPGSKALGSKSGYRQVQKGGESVLHDLDKLYIDKMLGKYNPLKEGSLPTKVKQVKKVKGVKPPKDSKRGKEFYKHHSYHSGPHIKGQGAEHATYDFDDDDYEVDGGLQKRKDKQKRGYEPVESVNERKNPKREKLKKDFKTSLKFVKGVIRKIDTFMKSNDWGVVDGFVTNKRTGLASLVKDMEKSMNQIIKLPVDESVNEADVSALKAKMAKQMDMVKKHRESMKKHSGKDKDKADRALARMKAAQAKVDDTQDKIIGIKKESVNERSAISLNLWIKEFERLAKKNRMKPVDFIKKHISKRKGMDNQVVKDVLKHFQKKESVNEAVEPTGNIKKVLDVAKNKQAKKIGGTLVDLTTSSMMTQVWDKVNDSSKEKMNKMNTKQLINLILKLWDRMGTPRV